MNVLTNLDNILLVDKFIFELFSMTKTFLIHFIHNVNYYTYNYTYNNITKVMFLVASESFYPV